MSRENEPTTAPPPLAAALKEAAIAALGRIYSTLSAWPELLVVHERAIGRAGVFNDNRAIRRVGLPVFFSLSEKGDSRRHQRRTYGNLPGCPEIAR